MDNKRCKPRVGDIYETNDNTLEVLEVRDFEGRFDILVDIKPHSKDFIYKGDNNKWIVFEKDFRFMGRTSFYEASENIYGR